MCLFDLPMGLSRLVPNTCGLTVGCACFARRSRSRRPWRTLFERILGSLPYGAVLSLTTTIDSAIGERTGSGSTAAATGKVVWANEGFEKLAGVDAVDIVGQDIAAVFAEGEEEEGEEAERGEGGELKRSLELGRVSLA